MVLINDFSNMVTEAQFSRKSGFKGFDHFPQIICLPLVMNWARIQAWFLDRKKSLTPWPIWIHRMCVCLICQASSCHIHSTEGFHVFFQLQLCPFHSMLYYHIRQRSSCNHCLHCFSSCSYIMLHKNTDTKTLGFHSHLSYIVKILLLFHMSTTFIVFICEEFLITPWGEKKTVSWDKVQWITFGH